MKNVSFKMDTISSVDGIGDKDIDSIMNFQTTALARMARKF